jgi:hypothetical protein
MKRASLVVILSSLLAQTGFATEWHVMGARAMGMGGAGVADSEGAVGEYWNPASLGQPESRSGLQIPVDVHAEVTGTALQGANDLHNAYSNCQNNPAACNPATIQSAINELANPNNGARVDAGAGALLKIKKLAVFVNNLTYIGATPYVDTTRINPTLPSDPNSFANNQSALILRGISVTEIGAGYGHEVPWVPGLYVGANLKALVGKVGYNNYLLLQNSAGSSGFFNKFLDGAATSVQPGIDLGALWDLHRTFSILPFHPRVGITARDINDPKFTNADLAKTEGDPSKFSLQGNTRVGAAISPLGFWTIAADADLTRNLTSVSGVASQNVGLGTEFNVFNRAWLNLPLRVGLARNIAESGSKTALTGGFGLNFLHFMVDASAMVSPSYIQTQSAQSGSTQSSQKIPANLSAGVQIGMLFGGGPQETPKPKED